MQFLSQCICLNCLLVCVYIYVILPYLCLCLRFFTLFLIAYVRRCSPANCLYTVSGKKGTDSILAVTLTNLDNFFIFLA